MNKPKIIKDTFIIGDFDLGQEVNLDLGFLKTKGRLVNISKFGEAPLGRRCLVETIDGEFVICFELQLKGLQNFFKEMKAFYC